LCGPADIAAPWRPRQAGAAPLAARERSMSPGAVFCNPGSPPPRPSHPGSERSHAAPVDRGTGPRLGRRPQGTHRHLAHPPERPRGRRRKVVAGCPGRV
jgi:hypothetical protein